MLSSEAQSGINDGSVLIDDDDDYMPISVVTMDRVKSQEELLNDKMS